MTYNEDETGYEAAGNKVLDYYVVDTYNEKRPIEDRVFVFIIRKDNGVYKLRGLEYEP